MEKRVADVVFRDWQSILDMSVAQLAAAAGVSVATVERFCRSIGIKGVSDFKMYLSREVLSSSGSRVTVEDNDSISIIAQKAFQFNKKAMDNTLSVLDYQALKRAVDAISAAHNVYIIVEGGSGCTARCAFHVFMQINIPCVLLDDPFLQVLGVNMAKSGDVAFCVCHSGQARNAVEAMRIARERGATTISVLGLVGSPLDKCSDISLYVGLTEHPSFSESLTARICELNILSALHTGLTTKNRDALGNYKDEISNLLNIKRIVK